jgi:hypothetical protein
MIRIHLKGVPWLGEGGRIHAPDLDYTLDAWDVVMVVGPPGSGRDTVKSTLREELEWPGWWPGGPPSGPVVVVTSTRVQWGWDWWLDEPRLIDPEYLADTVLDRLRQELRHEVWRLPGFVLIEEPLEVFGETAAEIVLRRLGGRLRMPLVFSSQDHALLTRLRDVITVVIVVDEDQVRFAGRPIGVLRAFDLGFYREVPTVRVPGKLPPVARAPAEPRFVNTRLRVGGTPALRVRSAAAATPHDPASEADGLEPAAPLDRSLDADSDYELLVRIGQYDVQSLVVNPQEHPFPDELPATREGHWLDVVASSNEVTLNDERHRLFLPVSGESWTCMCNPDEPHSCEVQERHPYVRIPLRTPKQACMATVEVAVYYRAAVVHAQTVTLPVDVPGKIGPSATITYSLTSLFVSLNEFAERAMSFLSHTDHEGHHRILVNGVSFAPFAFALTEPRASNAMSRARTQLFNTHLYERGGRWYSRYDPIRQTKPAAKYEEDLRRLAAVGANLFTAVFHDKRGRLLPQMLVHEARARGRPAIIQLAHSTHTRLLAPWQLLYDLPVTHDPASYTPCPSVLEWGPDRPEDAEIPAFCPHREEPPHNQGILCPFGFWGFAHILEVPHPSSESCGTSSPRTTLRSRSS